MSDLAASDVVGSWEPGLHVFMCPNGPLPPNPCDCGFVGLWERRIVYVWRHEPGYQRSDKTIRRDIAKNLPSRSNDEGWWCIGGLDERCPSCGDIERFDEDGNRVAQFAEQAKVIIFMDTRR